MFIAERIQSVVGVTVVGIVIGSEHALFVDLLGSALGERGFTVLEQAQCPVELERAVRRHRPDVCLVDGRPDTWPASLVRRLVEQVGTTVVRLIADDDEQTAREAVEAGARGCLYRSQTVEELATALRRIEGRIEGGVDEELLPRRTVDRAGRACSGREAHRLADALTGRERECLALVVEGAPTSRMVAELGISVTTVRSHVQSMLQKLGVRSRVEAASLAARHGLVPDDVRSAS